MENRVKSLEEQVLDIKRQIAHNDKTIWTEVRNNKEKYMPIAEQAVKIAGIVEALVLSDKNQEKTLTEQSASLKSLHKRMDEDNTLRKETNKIVNSIQSSIDVLGTILDEHMKYEEKWQEEQNKQQLEKEKEKKEKEEFQRKQEEARLKEESRRETFRGIVIALISTALFAFLAYLGNQVTHNQNDITKVSTIVERNDELLNEVVKGNSLLRETMVEVKTEIKKVKK